MWQQFRGRGNHPRVERLRRLTGGELLAIADPVEEEVDLDGLAAGAGWWMVWAFRRDRQLAGGCLVRAPRRGGQLADEGDMDDAQEFLTRHDRAFSLTSGGLDRSRSHYFESFSDYLERHSELEKLVGVKDFLWSFESQHRPKTFEMSKPVEWTVRVGRERIIGYVDEEAWFAFLSGKSETLGNCFTKERPDVLRPSVLLPFPLDRGEVIRRQEFRVENPHRAILIRDTACDHHPIKA